MKDFLEAIQSNEELRERVGKLDKDPGATNADIIALAKEYGYELSEADFAAPARTELSEDELLAVAGGLPCICFLGGGGEATAYREAVCACVAGGGGEEYLNVGKTEKKCRCACVAAGHGYGYE